MKGEKDHSPAQPSNRLHAPILILTLDKLVDFHRLFTSFFTRTSV
jgi:hypothetical protein